MFTSPPLRVVTQSPDLQSPAAQVTVTTSTSWRRAHLSFDRLPRSFVTCPRFLIAFHAVLSLLSCVQKTKRLLDQVLGATVCGLYLYRLPYPFRRFIQAPLSGLPFPQLQTRTTICRRSNQDALESLLCFSSKRLSHLSPVLFSAFAYHVVLDSHSINHICAVKSSSHFECSHTLVSVTPQQRLPFAMPPLLLCHQFPLLQPLSASQVAAPATTAACFTSRRNSKQVSRR